MANAFNSVSKGVIFQKFHATNGDIIQLILFFWALYAFESPLFYNHHNHESDVTMIPSTMGTHQSDLLWGSLFVLTHFRALHSITNCFPSCLFPSIANNMCIINPLTIMSSVYEHFQTELYAMGLFIQPHKCVTWSPFNLLLYFNTPSQFTTPSEGIRVWEVPLDTPSFTSSVIKYALLKYV